MAAIRAATPSDAGLRQFDGAFTRQRISMNDTIQKRVEAHANELLWAADIIGPDKIWAIPSHAEAVSWSDSLNAHTNAKECKKFNPLCFAYPIPWDRSADKHVTDMDEEAAECEVQKLAFAKTNKP